MRILCERMRTGKRSNIYLEVEEPEDIEQTGNRGLGMHYEIGDIVKLKKKHPCGSFEWEILRTGADFRLKCTGCGHQVMMERKIVEKSTKEIRKKA